MRTVFSLRPTTYRMRSKLIGAFERGSRCVQRLEIAPGSSVLTAAAISLPGEIDRMIEAIDSSDLARERRSVEAVEVQNHATVAYRYEDALLADGCWYAAGEYDFVQSHARRRPLFFGAERAADGVRLS